MFRQAPYLSGRLGDISDAGGLWNQGIDSGSRKLLDESVHLLSDVSVVYL
jgi:hypothetical protein